jgi:uncharacterized membrane protein YfcA
MNEAQAMLAFDPRFAVFALFVAVAFTTEAAIGFGSMLIAVTLGALLYPIPMIVPVLVCLSVASTSVIVLRNLKHVAWRPLLTQILPGMGVGMIVSYSLFADAPNAALKTGLGVFVVAVAVIELRRMTRPAVNTAPVTPFVFGITTFGAGIVHGITATGGPVLVYAVGRMGLSKSEFRATLVSVWLTLNASLAVTFSRAGRLDSSEAPYVGALIPVLAASILAGDLLHGHLDERTFRIIVLVMLMIAGLLLTVF